MARRKGLAPWPSSNSCSTQWRNGAPEGTRTLAEFQLMFDSKEKWRAGRDSNPKPPDP